MIVNLLGNLSVFLKDLLSKMIATITRSQKFELFPSIYFLNCYIERDDLFLK